MNVTCYSELNKIMHKECATLARLYWLLHEFQEGGKGWMSPEEIHTVVKERIGWGRQYTRSILAKGEGVVWERWEHKRKGTKINIFKPARVGQKLNCQDIGQKCPIPVEAFRKLSVFKAYLRKTWLEEKQSIHVYERDQDGGKRDEVITTEGRTISRAAQKELFGISKPTQIKQERLAGIEVQPCFAKHEWNEAYRDFLPIRDEDGGQPHKERGQWIERSLGGKETLKWQIPNRYQDRSNLEIMGRLGDSNWVSAGSGRRYYETKELYEKAVRKDCLHEEGVYVFEKEFDYNGKAARMYKFIPNPEKVKRCLIQ